MERNRQIAIICATGSAIIGSGFVVSFIKSDEVLMNQLLAVFQTVSAWFKHDILGLKLPPAPSKVQEGDQVALEIVNPGGVEQLRKVSVPKGAATTGYNVARRTKLLFSTQRTDLVKVDVSHFSINFADIAIRLGLYESAIRNVGYPIVPGFDVSGVISSVPRGCKDFKVGDHVYGATLFGGYSEKVSVPTEQLRKIPKGITLKVAASLPAVSLTAIHALVIAGFTPNGLSKMKQGSNSTILVHSASGGVGGMLVQFAKLCGATRVVGVVGRSEKVEYCKGLGADVVVCKQGKTKKQWWGEVMEGNEGRGFKAVFDANGVETIKDSYESLDRTGRLVVYGFHTNMTHGTSLNPISWLRMLWGAMKMPSFDAMMMTLDSRGVLGFNLSFFENETELIGQYFDILNGWLEQGIILPKINLFGIDEVGKAHELIQSGKSQGKIVIETSNNRK